MACFQRFNRAKGLALSKVEGFTLIELLVVLGIVGLLALSAVVALGTLRGGSDAQAEARGLSRVLELAKSKTIASEGDTRYGVYVDTSASPHQYVLFQTDTDYASRVVSEDQAYKLRDTIEFTSASFTGLSGQEVVFDRIQGSTSNIGSAVLRTKADPNDTTTVYVEESGTVEIDSSAVPTDNDREKDTRHVHIDYNRAIVPANETIRLTFSSPPNPNVIQDIAIANFLSGGQIVWQGEVSVYGDVQKLKIHTHTLNSGVGSNETKFSVHRDRRFNTKPLTIEINGSPDPDLGTVIVYDATGNITQGTSAYVLLPPVIQ